MARISKSSPHRMNLFLFDFLISIGVCLGASLSLSGSSSYAVLNQQFTFTCTVTQAADLNNAIRFFKKSASDSSAFVILTQTTSSCSVFSKPPEGYTASCGSGTSSSSSSTKKYTLTINSVIDRDSTSSEGVPLYSDATDWWCDLNTAGSPSTRVSLLVYKGPDSIRFSPTSPGPIIEGQTLSVRCSADCVPSPCSFSWKQGNTHISSNSQLTQTNITRYQTRFTCTAANTVTSTSKIIDFQLTVNYPPSAPPVISGTAFPVKEGDTVTLLCSTSGGKPKPNLTWSCPGSGSCSDSGETRTCTISFTANRNQNNKICVCTPTWQDGGYTQSTSTKMKIYYQPTITSVKLNLQSTKITVDELTPMTLSCDVDSNPASDIKLLNNSHTLYEVKNSKTAEYTWNKAGCLDTGPYTCEAGNNIKSTVSQSVQLTVRCSPRIDHRVAFQDMVGTSVGGDVSLTIFVIANPAPTFTWYNLTNGKFKLGSSNPVNTTDVSAVGSHMLTNVQEVDRGIYQVVVSNGGPGSNLVKNFTVVAQGPPSVPSNMTVWSTGSSSISVSWIEDFDGGLSQMFLVQYRADETSEWRNVSEVIKGKGLHAKHTAEISNLQPNTKYWVRVLAYNTEGNKGFTTTQNVLTSAEAIKTDSSAMIGGVVGGLVGGLVVIIIVILLVLFFIRRRKQNSTPSEKPIIANDSNQNVNNPAELYAVVNKPKKDKGAKANKTDEEKKSEGSSEAGPVYAVVNKKKKTKAEEKNTKDDGSEQAVADPSALYAVVDKSKKTAAVKKLKEKPKEKPQLKPKAKSKDKKKKEADDEKHIYGNDNMAFDKEERKPRKAKRPPPAPQVVYTQVEFGSQKPTATKIHQAEEPTVYIDIDFTKKAPPMPDDPEDENDTK